MLHVHYWSKLVSQFGSLGTTHDSKPLPARELGSPRSIYDSSHLRSVPACDRPEWLTVEAHNPVAADPTGQWLRALNEAENPQGFSRPDRLLRSRIPTLRFTLMGDTLFGALV